MRRALIAATLSAAFLATADAKEQRGVIMSIDSAAKTFVCQWNKKEWTYKTTDKTGFRKGGKDVNWSDLTTGARVNIGYHMAGDERVADWIVILR
jgi:hypothetical protein